LALSGVIGNGVEGFIGIIALLVLGGDGKSNMAFLSETVFFLGWLGFLYKAAAPKYVVYLSAR